MCLRQVHVVETKPGVTSGAIRRESTRGLTSTLQGWIPTLSPPDTNITENITYDQYDDETSVQSAVAYRVSLVVASLFIPIATEAPGRRSRHDRTSIRFGVFFLQT